MKVLIVVDYQNDFVDGALGFKGAESIENESIRLVKEFKNNGDLVFFTKKIPTTLVTADTTSTTIPT